MPKSNASSEDLKRGDNDPYAETASDASDDLPPVKRVAVETGSDDDAEELQIKKADAENFADDVVMPGANVENVKILSTRLPVTFLREQLADRVASRHMLRDFVLHIPFVIAFVFFVFGRRQISEEFFFTESVKNYIVRENLPPTNPIPGSDANAQPYFHKDFTEVGNYGDIYDFMESILAPRLFTNDPVGRDLRNRRFNGQNILIGSVRIRAKHVRNDTCTPNEAWYPSNTSWFPRVCYGPYNSKNEMTHPFRPASITFNYSDACEEYPLQWLGGKYATSYSCSGYTFDIPFNTSLTDALALIAQFRNEKFFRLESLRLAAVEFFTYNPAINTFMSAKVLMEVTEGGGFLPYPRVRAFVVFPGSAGWIVYNVFFLCMVLFYMYRFIIDWMRHAQVHKSKIQFLLSVWNLMQFFNLVIFIPVYIIFFRWVDFSDDIRTLFPETVGVSPDPAYPDKLSAVAELYQTNVYLNAINTIFTFLVLLKFAQLNDRLSILQRTVGNAVQPLLAVLIIFVIVVFSYSLAGTLIFGTGVEGFRNVDWSFVSLFRVLVGDFDYWEMWGENRALAFVFFWSYVILALFILLNFIVAIMMGAFSEENAKLKPKSVAVLITETVERQRNTVIARVRKIFEVACSTKRMPEDTLLEKLNDYLEDYSREAVAADDDFEIETFEFGRYDLFKIIPRAELEDIGDEYLDAMWYAIVDDWQSALIDEDDEEREEAVRHVYEFVKEAIGEFFNDYRLKLFGDKHFLTELDNRRLYMDDDTREEAQQQYDSIHELKSVPIRMRSGKVPHNTSQYVTELAERTVAVQRSVGLSRELMLDATGDCPEPVRRDAIPHPMPPAPPAFSGAPSIDARGELPDLTEAKRKAARNRRAAIKTATSRGGSVNEDLGKDGEFEDGPVPPSTAPTPLDLDAITVTEVHGNQLPRGGDWLRTEADDYVWSRRHQCFLHAPTGHLCTAEARTWYVPESGRKQWITPIERREYVDKHQAAAREEQRQRLRKAASQAVGATVTFDIELERQRAEDAAAAKWLDDMSGVPPLEKNSTWKAAERHAFSVPMLGSWEVMPDHADFFVDKANKVYYHAASGHFYDPVSHLWFVPALGKWLAIEDHEAILEQHKATNRY